MACLVEGGGPEGIDDREETPPPLMKEQIEGHVSALKSLIKSHNRRNKGDLIRLDFKLEDTEVQDHNIAKGKGVMDEDLGKSFKEARRTPLTRRIIEFAGPEYKMPANIKLYDGTTDPEDHLSRFASAANSGEWPMPVCINEWADLRVAFAARYSVKRACFKETHEITKIVRKANESLMAFKERWTVKTGFIMGVLEVMKISSFMDSVKSPELATRFSDKVTATVNEMMESLDDFVRSEEAYASTKLPKGETGERKKRKVRETTESWINIPISFPTISLEDIFEEPLIVEAEVEGYLVRRVYVDEGSSVEVMFEHCFENLNPIIKARLKETQTNLVGFAEEISKPLGKIELEACFGNEGMCRRTSMKFIVVRAPSPYNIILGRPGLKILRAIPFTIHSMMKFLTPKGVATLVTRTVIIAECRRLENKQIIEEESSEGEKEVAAMEEVLVNPLFPDQRVTIGRRLSQGVASAGGFSLISTERRKGRAVLPEAGGPSGIEYTYALRLTFPSTNNEAEYEALLAGFRIARLMNLSHIEVKVDSKLVANQINRSYEVSKDNMIKYLARAKEHAFGFKSFSIENIPKTMNQKADILSKLASVAFNHLTKEVMVEVLNEWSTEGVFGANVKSVGPLQANYVIHEIHMGSCGMHVGPRAIVRKAVRQGYYWLTMHEDSKKEVQKCDSCQINAPVPRLPKTLMTSIMAPWPFYQWGMDILGPLPPTRGGAKFIIVAVDYFTKWIEDKPLVRIMGKEVIRFVIDNIICRFGLPRIIVTDNGAQLVNDPFKRWCERFEIHQMNTAVAHPQANELVKRANMSLIEGIKTQVEREKAGWVDELPNVLWAHRTSIKQSNGKTPFSLTYGSEAVIPAEIGIPTYQTLMTREGYNEEEMRLNLDILHERRETAAIREARYKTKMEQYYKKVRSSGFRPGEFVI
nr:reverse transcriptase domain-containing protein [Tanacetum cinerariifolium]